MVSLDELKERESRIIDPSTILKVKVRTIDDIRIVVSQLDPKYVKPANKADISTVINSNEDGKNISYKVEATTTSKSIRDMVIEGLDIVKSHIISNESEEEIEINGRAMKPPRIGDNVKAKSWVDPLIKDFFDAYRDGLLLCWDIDGYKYRYDIYNHKLDRISKGVAE